jgi:hypothetical protein
MLVFKARKDDKLSEKDNCILFFLSFIPGNKKATHCVNGLQTGCNTNNYLPQSLHVQVLLQLQFSQVQLALSHFCLLAGVV